MKGGNFRLSPFSFLTLIDEWKNYPNFALFWNLVKVIVKQSFSDHKQINMQLLRIILIIIIVYYLLKFAARYLLPLFLKYAIRKTQENIKQQQAPERKTGEINVEYSPKKKPQVGHIGEYVDYEEIKD